MNARSTNRPGGRGRRRPDVRTSGADPDKGGCLRFGCDTLGCGCLILVAALAGIPALAEVIWG